MSSPVMPVRMPAPESTGTGGASPEQDASEPDVNLPLVQLASRIATHLHANPHDRQARDDLRYVVSRMQGPQGTAAQANQATTRQAQEEGQNLGPVMTFGQRAGNAMSLGLGDVAGRALEGPEYDQVVQQSEHRNPVSAIAGSVVGGAVPFMLPGSGALGARTAIGALEGFGIGDGSLPQRLVRAGIGAGGAAVAPAVLRGASGVVRGTLGRVLGRGGAAVDALRSAATEAPAAAAEGGDAAVGALRAAGDATPRVGEGGIRLDTPEAQAAIARARNPTQQVAQGVVDRAAQIGRPANPIAQQAAQAVEPVDPSDIARTAHAQVMAATGDAEAAKAAARTAAGTARANMPTPSEPGTLEPELEGSLKVSQLLAGRPSTEARTTLLDLLQQMNPPQQQAVARQLPAQWKMFLGVR